MTATVALLALSLSGATLQENVRSILESPEYEFCYREDYALYSDEHAWCDAIGPHSSVCPAFPSACKLPTIESLDPCSTKQADAGSSDGAQCSSNNAETEKSQSGTDDRPRGSAGPPSPSNPLPSSSTDDPSARYAERNGTSSGCQQSDAGPSVPQSFGGRLRRSGGRFRDRRLPKGWGEADKAQGGGRPEGVDGQKDGRREEHREPSSPISVPAGLGGVFRVVFFVLLSGFALWVIQAVVRNFVRQRGPDMDEGAGDETGPAAPRDPQGPTPRGAVETDVARLLARSRAAAAKGQFSQAIEDAYAALLRRLDGHGLIDIHPSRTNGDYMRSLHERPELRAAVRDIAGQVEQVQFGTVSPTDDIYRAIYERIVPICGQALAFLLVAFSLGTGVGCGLWPKLGTGEDTTDRHRPLGMQAVVELLGRNGVEVEHRTRLLGELDGPCTLVLLPGFEISEERWGKVLAWVQERGGSVVVAGAWPWPDRLGGPPVEAQGHDPSQLEVSSYGQDLLGDLNMVVPEGDQLASSKANGSPLLHHQNGAAYGAVYRVSPPSSDRPLAGAVVVLADDKLFTNISLTVRDNADFLIKLFDLVPGPVEVCDDMTGVGAATPIESVSNAHLTPVVLQALALLALALLYKGRAFGMLRDPAAKARRSFADHVRALGIAYARARAARHALGLYCEWAIDRLREQVHRSGHKGLIPLAEAIAARTGQSESEVMNVLLEASGLREDAAPPSSYRLSRSGAGLLQSPGQSATGIESQFAIMRELDRYLAATGGKRNPQHSIQSRSL